MSYQPELHETAPLAPSAWDWARAKYPGKVVVRVINVPTRKQAFVHIEAETGLLLDGSTHYLNSPGLSVDEERDLIAECDRHWHEHPCEQGPTTH